MTNVLIRFFIKNPEDTANPQVREAYGMLSGCVGIVCNLVLAAAKFVIGMLSGSIAIQADAVNNLSDVGSSVVTLIGFRAASRPADKEHPFGHARIEYIAALIIAFLILVVGFELGRESISKVLNPTTVEFDLVTMGVLVLSILVKLWMSRFTKRVGQRIQSTAISASTADSICDVVTTGAILISCIVGYFKNINIDGYIGVLVAGFVLYSGVRILKETISPLLGEAPRPEVVKELGERVMSYPGIIGMHDMVLHSYGPGKTIASVHAEVRSDANILITHEIIDRMEREIGEAMHMQLVIHLDPIETDNARLNAARAEVEQIMAGLGEHIMFHDFRMVSGDKQINLLFDIVVPPGMKKQQVEEMKARIAELARQKNPAYNCVITVDMDYTGV